MAKNIPLPGGSTPQIGLSVQSNQPAAQGQKGYSLPAAYSYSSSSAIRSLRSKPIEEEEEKWYKGTQPTGRETLAQIYTISQQDPFAGQQMWDSYQQLTQDPSTPLYAPYTKATNPAIGHLSELGVDVSEINDEWFARNASVMNHYRTGATGTPLAPSSTSSAENDAAYWYYKLTEAEETTKKAEAEWAALQEELGYWAGRSDRNYSDQQILGRIDWSNYPTLTRMDEGRKQGVPLSLNRPVGYSDDAIYGTLWAARNDGGTGNGMADSVQSVLGNGNVWEEDARISALLDPTSEFYNPYAAGSTVDDEALYFGVRDFSPGWLENNRAMIASMDETERKMYGKVYDAEQTTLQAEAELAQLQAEIKLATAFSSDADAVIASIDWRKYPTLSKMDKSLKSGDIMAMTRAVPYKKEDILSGIRGRCVGQPDALDNFAKGVTAVLAGAGKATPVKEEKKAFWKRDKENDKERKPSRFGLKWPTGDAETEDKTAESAESSSVIEESSAVIEESSAVIEESSAVSEEKTADKQPAPKAAPRVAVLPSQATGAIDQQRNRVLDAAGPDVAAVGTDAEKRVWQYARPSQMPKLVKEVSFGIETSKLTDEEALTLYRDTVIPYAASNYNQVSQIVAAQEQAAMQMLQTKAQGGDTSGIKMPYSSEEYTQAKAQLRQMSRAFDLLEQRGDKEAIRQISALKFAGTLMAMDIEEPTQYAYSVYDSLVQEGHSPEEVAQLARADLEFYEALESGEFLQTMAEMYGGVEGLEAAYPGFAQQWSAARAAGELDKQDAKYFLMQFSDDFQQVVADRPLRISDGPNGSDPLRSQMTGNADISVAAHAASDNDPMMPFYGEGDYNKTVMADKYSDMYLNLQENYPVFADVFGKLPESQWTDNLHHLTETELDTLYYIEKTQGSEAAQKYLEGYLNDDESGQLHVRSTVEMQERNAAYTREHPVLANIGAVLRTPGQLSGAVYSLTAQLKGEEINPYNRAFHTNVAVNSVRGTSKQMINESLGEDTFLGQLANFGYDIGVSLADSAYNGLLFGGASPYIMGTYAFSGAVQDAKFRGATDEQALGFGAVAFVAEVGSESVTQHVFKGGAAVDPMTFRAALTNAAKGMAEEGGSEFLTELVNIAGDEIIMGSLSNYDLNVERYMTELGMSRAAAERAARRDTIMQLSYATLAGIGSGGVTSLAGSAYNYVFNGHAYASIEESRAAVAEQRMQQQEFNQAYAAELRQQAEQDMPQPPQPLDAVPMPTETAPAPMDAVPMPASSAPVETAESVVDTEDADTVELDVDIEPATPAAETEPATRAKVLPPEQKMRAIDVLAEAENSDADGAVVTAVAAVLTDPEQPETAAPKGLITAIALADRYGELPSADIVKGILSVPNAPVSHDSLQSALSVAVAFDGDARKVLDNIAATYRVQPGDITALEQAAQADLQQPAAQEAVQQQEHDTRIALRTKELIADGALDGMRPYKTALRHAEENLTSAQTGLEQAQQQQAAAGENLQTVAQEHLKNPTEASMRGAVQQAAKDMEGAVIVTRQREEAVQKQEAAVQEAKAEHDAVLERTMKEVREQAVQEIAVEDEQAAQEAEAQAKAEEEAAAKAHTDAVALHKPKKPFLATVKAFDGTETHNIIGIHALSDTLDFVFMTDTGLLVSESLLDEASVDALMAAGLDKTAQQQAYNTEDAVVFLPQSVEAQMNETGEVVQIMGYGPTEGQTKPTYVLSNGEKVSSDAVTPLHSDSQDYLSLYFDLSKGKLQQAEKDQPGYVDPAAQTATANTQPTLQLESWQDPQYHGKVKPPRKLRTDTKNFQKWFSDPTGDLTNADGTPRLIYRGTTSKLYMEHAAGKDKTYKPGILNFYSPDLAIAKSYADGQGHIISTYDIRNWETAEAAMKAEGYELRKEQWNGEWGYRAYNVSNQGGWHAPSEFYRENEIAKFNAEYGGIRKTGLYAGYLSLKNPMVIDAHGSRYTSTHGTVKDKNGKDYTATMTNREWGNWARENGYDAAIIRNSKDYMTQNGPHAVPGTVIMTFDSSSFKSFQNTGKLSKKKGADIRYNKEGTFALTGKPVSTQMKSVLQRLSEGYDVPIEEIMATPEVQWAEENMERGHSMYPEDTKQGWEAARASLSPERASEQLDIIDTLMGRGSAEVDSDGKTSYTGGINQNRRLDVVIGPPAAGKSSALVNPLSQQFGSRVLDCDDVKAEFSEYQNGLNSNYLHNESRFIWNRMLSLAAQNGDNVVVPVVGHSEDSVNRDIKVFRDNGYDVHMHYVELDQKKTIGRALSRFVSEGRYIDPGYLMYATADNKISVNYEKFKNGGSINGYSKWSNDVPRGAVPERLETRAEPELDALVDRWSEYGGNGSGVPAAEGVQRGLQGSGSPGKTSGKVIHAKKGPGSTSAPAGISTDSTGKPKYSPQRIAKDLTKALGVGDRIGTRKMNNMPKAVLGYYEQRAKYISVRSKQAGNYTTTMHEIGHALADKLKMTGTKGMIAKLDPVFASNYSDADLPGEAFAEFMWRYMESEQRARDFAGDAFVDTFEQRLNKAKLRKQVKAAQKNLQVWINASVNDQIGAVIVDQSDANKKSWGQHFRTLISRMVDSSAALNAVDNAIRDQNDGKMPLGESIRNQVLLKNTAAQRAFNILSEGLTDSHWNIIADSLAKRFRDAGITAKDVDLLIRYVLALHSLDRDAQGKPVFDDHITQEKREAFIKDVQANHPEVVAAEKAWQEFRTEFLQEMLVKTGFMKQETLDLFNTMYPHYVPTVRVKEGATPSGRSGTYKVMRATGSTEDIINPMDSFVRMIDSVVTMVSANNAALAWDAAYNKYEGMGKFGTLITADAVTHTVDTTELNDAVRDLLEGNTDEDIMDQVLDLIGKRQSQIKSTGTSTEPGTLQVQLPNGTRRLYKIADPEMFTALASAQNGTYQHGAFAPLAWLTRGMSALTTGSNPIFGARNFMRDFQASVNYGSWATSYADGMAKWMRAAYDVWRQKGEYKDYQALGGGGWTQIYAGKQKSAAEYRAALYKGYNTSNVGRTAKFAGKKLWETVTLAKLNEVIEQTSRYAEYKYGKHDTATAEGRQEAFIASQDVTVDFHRRGSSGSVNVLKAVIPFFNASLQGVYRTERMYTEKGERGRLPQRFAKTVLNTALASALAAGLLRRFLDEEEEEEFMWLSADLKAQNLYLPNFAPDIFGLQPLIRIPLAQDPLTYAVHNAVTNAVWGGDDSVIELSATVDTILDNINPMGDPITQAWTDAQANRTWYGSRIVPMRMDSWDPTTQYTEETPQMFIALGRLTGQSPMVLQYLTEQYTGYVGQMAIPALSRDASGEIGGFDAASNAARKKLTSDPLVSNDVVSAFYDGYDMLSSVTSAVSSNRPLNSLRRNLTPEEAQNAYEEAYALTHKGGSIYEAKSFIGETYDTIDEINGRTDLTDEQKYELTSELRRDMIEVALDANETIQAYREKYITGESWLSRRLTEGVYTTPKTAFEKLPAVFVESADQPHMQAAKAVWEATGNESALPHPNREFRDGEDYVIGDDEWDTWCGWYNDAYRDYVAQYSAEWPGMSTDEQLEVLKDAHSVAHKYCKKQYLGK